MRRQVPQGIRERACGGTSKLGGDGCGQRRRRRVCRAFHENAALARQTRGQVLEHSALPRIHEAVQVGLHPVADAKREKRRRTRYGQRRSTRLDDRSHSSIAVVFAETGLCAMLNPL